MKVKRSDLLKFNSALTLIANKPASATFTYRMAKNRRKIKDEVESVSEAYKTLPGMAEYEKKRIDLCVLNCNKDDDGNPIIINNKYQLIDVGKFEKELAGIREEYADTIAEQNRIDEELEAFAEEEVEISLMTITPDDLPDGLTVDEVDALSIVIS